MIKMKIIAVVYLFVTLVLCVFIRASGAESSRNYRVARPCENNARTCAPTGRRANDNEDKVRDQPSTEEKNEMNELSRQGPPTNGTSAGCVQAMSMLRNISNECYSINNTFAIGTAPTCLNNSVCRKKILNVTLSSTQQCQGLNGGARGKTAKRSNYIAVNRENNNDFGPPSEADTPRKKSSDSQKFIGNEIALSTIHFNEMCNHTTLERNCDLQSDLLNTQSLDNVAPEILERLCSSCTRIKNRKESMETSNEVKIKKLEQKLMCMRQKGEFCVGVWEYTPTSIDEECDSCWIKRRLMEARLPEQKFKRNLVKGVCSFTHINNETATRCGQEVVNQLGGLVNATAFAAECKECGGNCQNRTRDLARNVQTCCRHAVGPTLSYLSPSFYRNNTCISQIFRTHDNSTEIDLSINKPPQECPGQKYRQKLRITMSNNETCSSLKQTLSDNNACDEDEMTCTEKIDESSRRRLLDNDDETITVDVEGDVDADGFQIADLDIELIAVEPLALFDTSDATTEASTSATNSDDASVDSSSNEASVASEPGSAARSQPATVALLLISLILSLL